VRTWRDPSEIERLLQAAEVGQGDKPANVERRLDYLVRALMVVGFSMNPDEPELLHRRAVAILESSLGPDHPSTGMCLASLAFYLSYPPASERCEEALELFGRGIRILENALGPDHLDLADPHYNLAHMLDERYRRHDLAMPHYRHALHIYGTEETPDRFKIAETTRRIAGSLTRLDRLDDAEALYRKALAMYESGRPSDPYRLMRTRVGLGALLEALGRLDEALDLYERVVDGLEESCEPSDWDLAEARVRVAAVMVSMSRQAEAEELLRRALAAYDEGPDSGSSYLWPWAEQCLSVLSSLLIKQGRLEESVPLLRRLLDGREYGFGPDAVEVAYALHSLGFVLAKLTHYDEAEQLLDRAVAIFEADLDPDDDTAAVCSDNLSWLRRIRAR
jgi:tetratricopeptide (TPR) repeat protein